MTQEFIPTFKTSHDPDDTAARNFGIGGVLRRVNGAYASAAVALSDDASANPDTALTITAVSYDPVTQRISFRLTGGTRGAKYVIRLRLVLVDGRRYDFSAYQIVRDH